MSTLLISSCWFLGYAIESVVIVKMWVMPALANAEPFWAENRLKYRVS